jgi:hypothetical protein
MMNEGETPHTDTDAARVGALDQMLAGATDTAKVVSAFYMSCVRQGVHEVFAAQLAATYLQVMMHNGAVHGDG